MSQKSYKGHIPLSPTPWGLGMVISSEQTTADLCPWSLCPCHRERALWEASRPPPQRKGAFLSFLSPGLYQEQGAAVRPLPQADLAPAPP